MNDEIKYELTKSSSIHYQKYIENKIYSQVIKVIYIQNEFS